MRWGASAYHHVIVGETDSGKTYGAHLLLYKEALRGTQVVVLEPMGESIRGIVRALRADVAPPGIAARRHHHN